MPTIKYWLNLGTSMNNTKYNIPKQCRISDIFFASFSTIVGNLFTRYTNNLKYIHKDSNDIL